SRAFTLGHFVNMDRVLAGRKIFEIQRDADAPTSRKDRRGADAFSLPILHLHPDWPLLSAPAVEQNTHRRCRQQAYKEPSSHTCPPELFAQRRGSTLRAPVRYVCA